MININRNNYEEYFIDYLDGNLSYSDKKIFLLFLEENLDLKEELEMFEEEAFVADEVIYERKENLKKSSLLTSKNENFDELCIAELEGDLSNEESRQFQEFLKEKFDRQKAYGIFQLTKMSPDKSIIYPDKKLLKHTESKLFSKRLAIISVAATILILVAIYLFVPQERNNVNNQMVAESSETLEEESKSEKLDQIQVNNNIEKEKSINHLGKDNKNILSEVKIEEKSLINNKKEKLKDNNNFRNDIARLSPKEVTYNFKPLNNEMLLAKVSIPEIIIEKEPKEEYHTVKTFLASAFNKRVLNKEDKDRIELFDIAQAGVEGINKLTGSNMKLERKLDGKGNPKKTEFNSRLIAFSAPVKKK